MSVYGSTPEPLTSAAGSGPDDRKAADKAAQLPQDLSDADLGLLEVSDEPEQPQPPHTEPQDLLQTLYDLSGQRQPLSVGTNAASGGQLGQGGPQASGRAPAAHLNLMQGLQQPPQQRLYSGPGTVAPPPSALPDPGSLTFIRPPPSYSTVAGGLPQANASLVQPAHAYHLLPAREPAEAGPEPAGGAMSLPGGQRAASGAQQQTGAACHIATPDNSAGLKSWQAITDGQQGSSDPVATTAAAAAGTAPGLGPSGTPAVNAGSFMREGKAAGSAGGFLGRDLFANQRSELSRRASPTSMWEAADQTRAAHALNAHPPASGGFPRDFIIHGIPVLPVCTLLSGMLLRSAAVHALLWLDRCS